MNSRLESWSTELFFEIFEYLSALDLLRAFIGLNSRLNSIVGSYPLRLNDGFLSYREREFVYRNLQPEQVISLVLADTEISNQLELFQKYFPDYEQQFTRLHTIEFINGSTVLSKLPTSVSSLSFIRCKYDVMAEMFTTNFERWSGCLTHLSITFDEGRGVSID